MAAGAFQEAIGLMFHLGLAQVGVSIMLGAENLTRPPAASAATSSSAACPAPYGHYETVGALGVFLGLSVLGSISLFFHVTHRIARKQTAPQMKLRLLALLSVALSAVGTGLVISTCFYVLEIKVGLVACMSAAVRACLYVAVAVVVALNAYVYYDLAAIAIFAD